MTDTGDPHPDREGRVDSVSPGAAKMLFLLPPGL